MSEGVKQFAIAAVIGSVVVLCVILIYLAGNNATNVTNRRLDHIGTACVKAGNTWVNNNCIPNYQINGKN